MWPTLAALMLGSGCAATADHGAAEPTSEPPLAGLRSCDGPDDPVAAFWGSDHGVGSPGRGPASPPGGDIWTITADGRVAAITHDATSRDPWISPDGARIYFARSAVGSLAGSAAPGVEVWVHEVRSGAQTRLVALPTDAEGQELTDAEESPDGSMVLYSASMGRPGAALPRLFIIDLNRAREPIALPPSLDPNVVQWQQEPTVSPDGTTVAYLHTAVAAADPAADPQTSIRLIDLATRQESVLYRPDRPESLHGLEWSPDGSSVLVTEDFATALAIDVDTGDRQVLATNTTFGVTYSAADGRSVSGVGATWAIPEASDHLTNLTTWKDDAVTTAEFPVRLSFAAGLTIADCAYT